MDDPQLDAKAHTSALAGLARLNAWSNSAGAIWPIIRDEARRGGGGTLRILDVATGSGDIPIALARRASRKGYSLQIDGCDRSDVAVQMATQRAQDANVATHFFQHDIAADTLPTGYDIITASLFLHHLADHEASAFLLAASHACKRMLIVNDLSRSRLNYGLVWMASRLLSRSPVVHFDGPVSVKAAFTPAEITSMTRSIGLKEAVVVNRFPCRWLMTWRKSG